MNWLFNWVKKWADGKVTKAGGTVSFIIAAAGIAINIRPDLLPMVDVMSWNEIGGWICGGFAGFGLAGKADKLIVATKENTAAVQQASVVNVIATGEVADAVGQPATRERQTFNTTSITDPVERAARNLD